MGAAVQPELEPGRVYRTKDLAIWGANAPRLAKRLVREGRLVQLAQGLFACPKFGSFGRVPPSDEEVMRAFLDGGPFVFTGPDRWNTLGLGSTAVFAWRLVYNTKRSGIFDIGGNRYILRRVAFPEYPTAEWFVVDLIENVGSVGISKDQVAISLVKAIEKNTFDVETLRRMADLYGTRDTQALIRSASSREK